MVFINLRRRILNSHHMLKFVATRAYRQYLRTACELITGPRGQTVPYLNCFDSYVSHLFLLF